VPGAVLARLPLGEAWPVFARAQVAGSDAPGEDALLATANEAYLGELGAPEIALVLRRATFVQQLLAAPAADGSDEAAALTSLARTRPRLCRWQEPLFAAVGDQCATELAAIVAAAAARPDRVTEAVASLFETLLGAPASERTQAHVRAVTRRPRASGYLTHDLHVYKAKSFPRMARRAQPGAAARRRARRSPARSVRGQRHSPAGSRPPRPARARHRPRSALRAHRPRQAA